MAQKRYIIHITMLALWLFTCLGQPIVTIFDDGKPLVTNNLNEEEHKEQQGKKNNEEEKIISDSSIDFVFLCGLNEPHKVDTYTLGFSDCIRQIVLPPPEQYV
ncbi:hypothetical protein [Sediminicola sp. 1XM1-17]|uniref:hypothetical protein n=1 Tax=Sediminicola sp. 1XM1-17 TaxID=3127702 RepID=UPI00307737F9